MPLPHRTVSDPLNQDNFDDLDNRLAVIRAGGGAFTAPTLAGSWANSGGSNQTAGYLKDPMGFVHLRGCVKSGSGTIFTLPTGYRPSADILLGTYGDGAFAAVSITSAGVVALSVGAATIALSLDSITFKAA